MVYPEAVRVGNSPNSSPRTQAVSQVILHHTANPGNVEGVWDMFMKPNDREVSANFLVAQNGDVYECMNPDTRRAWTTGGAVDQSSITLECMNSTGAPEWGQSAQSQEAIAKVLAWASRRYGFDLYRPSPGVVGTVRGHREVPGQSTACPGGMPMDSIVARANQILCDGDDDGFNDTDRYSAKLVLESASRVEKNFYLSAGWAKTELDKASKVAELLTDVKTTAQATLVDLNK